MSSDKESPNITASKGQKSDSDKQDSSNSDLEEMMTDANYLRQSSSLINDALQKGFDVLQLEDGDIVTTATKTVIYQYHWDKEASRLVKVVNREASTKSQVPKVRILEDS